MKIPYYFAVFAGLAAVVMLAAWGANSSVLPLAPAQEHGPHMTQEVAEDCHLQEEAEVEDCHAQEDEVDGKSCKSGLGDCEMKGKCGSGGCGSKPERGCGGCR
jgi:hypothetical protein